jgi:hypothetical protein
VFVLRYEEQSPTIVVCFCPLLLISIVGWHKARITYASPTEMTYSIAYPNGDTASEIKRHCMQNFKPYTIGEEVGLLENRKGRIISIQGNGTHFDIQFTDNNNNNNKKKNVAGDDDVMLSVPVEDLYRSIPYGGPIEVGMKVLTRRYEKKNLVQFDEGPNTVKIAVNGQEFSGVKVNPSKKKTIFSPGIVTAVLDKDWYEVDIERRGEEKVAANHLLCLEC